MARHDLGMSQTGEEFAFERGEQETATEPATQQPDGSDLNVEISFQAIVEMAPDAIIVSRTNGRIILVNRQTEILFGYDRASLLGQPVEILIPERFHSAHVSHRANYATEPRTRVLGADRRLLGRRRDGSEFPIQVSLSPLNTNGEPMVIANVSDLSELRRAEDGHAALETANQELRQLLTLTDTALSNLALDDMLRELMGRAREVMRVDNVAILLLDESGQELRVSAASGFEEQLAAQAPVPIGQGFVGRIADTRAPLVVDDLSGFPVVLAVLRERMRSAMGVPLLVGERLLGVLYIASSTLRHFSDQDVRMLQLVGERIALAIDRVRMHEATLAAQAEAERERARWRAAMDSAPAFVLTCDADLRLTYINPAYEGLLGPRADLSVRPEERPARFGLLRPDGSGFVAADQTPLARALRERRVIPGFELLYRTPSGAERLVRWDTAPIRAGDGSILGAVAVGWDITEQRRLERAAREYAAQLEAIFEAVTDGIVVINKEARNILSNTAYREILARIHVSPPSELLSERVARSPVLDEQGQPLPMEQWPQVRAMRGEVISGANAVRMLRRAATGEDIVFSVTAAPLRDAEGAITGAVSVIHDVTMLKQLERERHEARARELAALEVSRRLDEFFAIAVHDIRNPVTTVYTSVEVLQRRLRRLQAVIASGEATDQTTTIEALDRSLRTTRTSVERLIRLINRLFDIAQARAGKLALQLAPCDLVAVLREQIAAQQERVIQVELPEDRPIMVMADADRIGEVLANYLSNALKYSPPDLPITVRLEVAAGRANVAVRDQGPGLPPMEQALVWEIFHRAPGVSALGAVERQGASLGLGLHICKRLIEAHPGGEVGVESEVGSGSTFWFALPLLSDIASTDASQAPHEDGTISA